MPPGFKSFLKFPRYSGNQSEAGTKNNNTKTLVINATGCMINNSHQYFGLCFKMVSTKVKEAEMSRDFTDNNKDIDSEAEVARRRSFIRRMEEKLAYKEALQGGRA